VLSGAAPGGDGTEAAPLSNIGEALALAASGTIIAIGKEVYAEPVRLSTGITLWGACAPETRLTTSSPVAADLAIVTVATANTRLLNLRLGPADLPGLAATGLGASVEIDGLLVEDAQGAGVIATDGARVHGRTLSVADTRAESTGENGQGIVVSAAGALNLLRVVVSRNLHFWGIRP